MTNQNHPAKGSQITVDPIRSLRDIATIKRLLADRPRDLCLFIIGINTCLRASDLINIKVGQVRDLEAGGDISLRETKTGKPRRVTLNAACLDAIHSLLATRPDAADDEALLAGQRGPLTVPSVHRLVKGWCRAINLKGNYGSHTLRKTFGYHQRVTFKVAIPELVHIFNHSHPKQTLHYLCIQPEEVRAVYLNEI